MKHIRNFLLLSLAFLAFQAVDAKAQTPQTALEKQVFKEILKMPNYGVFDHISYKVDGTTVTLFGKVADARNKRDAERWVKDIAGVETVVNQIEILPASSFDNRIRQNILRSFSSNGLYSYLWGPNPAVRIIVDGGHVELEGFVSNKGDSNLMNMLANSTSGVFGVQNNLIVGGGKNR